MQHPILSSVARAVCPALACTLIAACGIRSASATAAGDQSPCSITLTGAKIGTFDCYANAFAAYAIRDKTTQLALRSKANPAQVMIGIKFPGIPTTKTYKSSDAGAAQQVWVGDGNAMWVAQGITEDHAIGNYAMTLTAVKEIPYASDAKGYAIHGTITATLQPDPDTNARGTVTLTARF